MSYPELLQYLGALSLATITYKTLIPLYHYLKPSTLSRYHHNSPGTTWALVTGSTSGIGEGFAHALCAKNFNVLLHGRSIQKLEALQKTLLSKYPGREVRYVVADAFDTDANIEGIAIAAAQLPGKLTVLINNVGGAPLSPSYGALSEIDASHADKMINLNLRFPTQLTRALLPLLTQNTPALIMNLCSITGLRGFPYLATYSGSKAYNHAFSESLFSEFKAEGTDIEVLGILVASAVSGGNKTDKDAVTCDSREMADFSLGRVGCGLPTAFGWWRHGVVYSILKSLPDAVLEGVFTGAMRGRREIELKESKST